MNHLKELRIAKNISLRKLSEDIKLNYGKKISRASLNNYENGETEPKKDTWEILADYYHVDPLYLRGLNPIKNHFDNSIYEESISTMVDLVNENGISSAKIKEIMQRISIYLELIKDTPDLVDSFSKILLHLETITPYPSNDSFTINMETGNLLDVKESINYILKDKKYIVNELDNLVKKAIESLSLPENPISITDNNKLIIHVDKISDEEVREKILALQDTEKDSTKNPNINDIFQFEESHNKHLKHVEDNLKKINKNNKKK
ncbi:helix-turn-helix domain-containing protein [Liquorilactobacillus mali]|uniref:helix-turn-helix domain-containing protein n=1 Tax=Liquorilactobacillus mali TaxID=1618 RepID=UPI002350D486|nr:helix-turn-helix transcriptional regulator [Liquorilactobacillus mali]MDC7952497.1 helix-turn-helix transcriptional regulator [Liquorilactobacillus mali]